MFLWNLTEVSLSYFMFYRKTKFLQVGILEKFDAKWRKKSKKNFKYHKMKQIKIKNYGLETRATGSDR